MKATCVVIAARDVDDDDSVAGPRSSSLPTVAEGHQRNTHYDDDPPPGEDRQVRVGGSMIDLGGRNAVATTTTSNSLLRDVDSDHCLLAGDDTCLPPSPPRPRRALERPRERFLTAYERLS